MAKAKPPKRRRLTYRAHTDEQVRQALKAAIPEGGVIMDWLELSCLDMVDGHSEWDRGVAEGMRRKASEIMTMVLTDEEIKVEKNV